jgi:hypothetical protein
MTSGGWFLSLRRPGAKRRNLAHIFLALGLPRIVGRLHAHPNARAVTKQFAEPNRDGRRDRLALTQYVIKVLAGNTEEVRDLGLSPAGCRNDILTQQSAGMRRATSGVTLSDMSHDLRSSVILLEIDTIGVAVLELECYAPGTIHMHRMARGIEPAQRMEIEPWDIHFFRPRSDIQAVKATQDAWVHLHIDPLGSAAFPKLNKSFVFEAPDHN